MSRTRSNGRTVISTSLDDQDRLLRSESTTPVPHSLATHSSSLLTTASAMPGSGSLAGSMVSLSDGVRKHSVLTKYVLPADPQSWAEYNGPEADDAFHDPEKSIDTGSLLSTRGFANLGCVILLVVGLVTLFAGYPIITHFTAKPRVVAQAAAQSLNLVTNATGNIPSMQGKWTLIDDDTPQAAYTIPSYTENGKTLQLVFSDEFNTPGRTFYPGDDPFWEAVDLYYWQTVDLEWYDPAAITTANGALEITFSAKQTHDLNYQGGMMATWNNFCFTGGIVVAAVQLPGVPTVSGFWPAVWTMGNLGRVGYGATTDGLWPYSYDACDYGTVPNQTINGQPAGALIPGMGDPFNNGAFSYLPGQRLSRCTCPEGPHPGPKHSDGSFVGRSAPEIDLFEATTSPNGGNLSQSVQMAPFNQGYFFLNGTGDFEIYNPSVTSINSYHGGAYQEAISALSVGNQSCYELVSPCFSTYAIEYRPGFDDAYITWVSNGLPTWTLNAGALGPDERVNISARPVSQEPMYLIMNLGMSPSFQRISPDIQVPAKMRVDYVRVYQDPDNINIGCDPKDFPTMDYIQQYISAYTNPNFTVWSDIGQSFPKNSFYQTC